MTRVLIDGTIIVDPSEVGLLAVFVREGVGSLGARRGLPPLTAPLLAAVEQGAANARAAAAARSGAGTAVSATSANPALSTATVTEAARRLTVSEEYVRRLCRSGGLVAERRGPVWTINTDSLASFALSRQAA